MSTQKYFFHNYAITMPMPWPPKVELDNYQGA